MMIKYIFLLVFINSGTRLVGGVIKKWLPSKNLGEASNWKNGVLPCGGREADLSQGVNKVMLSGSLSTSMLTLSDTTDIIFSDGAELVIDVTYDKKCSGDQKKSKWVQRTDHWYDPKSWFNPSTNMSYDFSSATPHIRRPPCQYDAVLFDDPEQSLYVYHLEPPQIKVFSLTMGNKSYSTSKFSNWLKSPEGKHRVSAVSIDGGDVVIEDLEQCQSATGCTCRDPSVMAGAREKICSYSKPCPDVLCEKPIIMEGFCCPICGSDIELAINQQVTLPRIQEVIKKIRQTSELRKVDSYVNKMEDNKIHVFFTDGKDSLGDYQLAASVFKTEYKKEQGSGECKVTMASGNTLIMSALRQQQTNSALIGIGVIALVVMVLAAAYWYRKKRPRQQISSFSFRRLSRRISMVSVASHRSPSLSSITPTNFPTRESGANFVNPMFNQSMSTLAAMDDIEEAEVEQENIISEPGENPLYSEIERLTMDEETSYIADKFVTSLDQATGYDSNIKDTTLVTIPEDSLEDNEFIESENSVQTSSEDKCTPNVDISINDDVKVESNLENVFISTETDPIDHNTKDNEEKQKISSADESGSKQTNIFKDFSFSGFIAEAGSDDINNDDTQDDTNVSSGEVIVPSQQLVPEQDPLIEVDNLISDDFFCEDLVSNKD